VESDRQAILKTAAYIRHVCYKTRDPIGNLDRCPLRPPMTATEILAIPTQRYTADVQEEKVEDEDDDPIASINAMSITVGDHDSSSIYTARPKATIATSTKTTTTSSLAPLPTPSIQAPVKPTSSLRSLLGVPPLSTSKLGGGSLLGVPPSTSAKTAPAGIGGASGARIGGTPASSSVKTLPSEIAPKRRKVILGPGCSALDWARLKSSIPSKGFRKIRPSELKLHNTKQDAWSAFNGKVYDMTPYMRFHPGGEDELMRVAGRDGTRLFMLTHSWVNIDSMIDSCVIGILVPESSPP
jgi:cytochrome b involved in lipid metabolism